MSHPWTWLKDIGGNVDMAELFGYSNGCGNGKGYVQGKMEIDRGTGNTCAK